MDRRLPIVADILLNVLPTTKWACVRQFPRQRPCFPGYLSMLWTSLAFLTCSSWHWSQVYPALRPDLSPWYLYWQFWLAYPRNGLQNPFLVQRRLCHVAVRLRFPVRISNKYSLGCDGEVEKDQQDFRSFIWASKAAWHRAHFPALWTACEHFGKSCAVVSPQTFWGTGSSEMLAVWELWKQEYYSEEPFHCSIITWKDL